MSLHILGGAFKGRPLKSPSGNATRPTQGILRQAVFNICQHTVAGSRFLDLFAGSGAMGLEALSWGAAAAVFVEKNKFALQAIRENIRLLDVAAHARVLALDALSALKQFAPHSFDLIYIDPPYEHKPLAELALIEQLRLLAPHGLLFVEEAAHGEELTYPPTLLKKKNTRRFGIARLHQFEALA